MATKCTNGKVARSPQDAPLAFAITVVTRLADSTSQTRTRVNYDPYKNPVLPSEENGGEDNEGTLALANATEKVLQLRDNPKSLIKGTAKSGPEYFAARSYQESFAKRKNGYEPHEGIMTKLEKQVHGKQCMLLRTGKSIFSESPPGLLNLGKLLIHGWVTDESFRLKQVVALFLFKIFVSQEAVT
uniref:Uncharacterized protein n=1 Tax=Fagus sylvatica TaxID=28930 RepID=A0A2N9IT40_FAGSY